MKRKATTKRVKNKNTYDGNTEQMISTGSTLLDLAISGGRKRGGGIPGGIMVVAYGPSSSGKTVLACEVAGYIQRAGGQVKYKDSEARLNKKFSELFDLKYDDIDYEKPNTVTETFLQLHKWQPDTSIINGYIVDSLAALSTDMEMEKDEGDKMGMKRAKDFSEQLRKGARKVTENNILLFCTNQIRENAGAGLYERKDVNPGGKAIEFYSSLILRFTNSKKIPKEITFHGKKVKRAIGIKTTVEVVKSSVWEPFHTAPISIYFQYGIHDIQENLQFIKDFTKNKVYTIGGESLSNSMEASIKIVEDEGLEDQLKEEVIDLWEEIEKGFKLPYKKKKR